MSQRESPNPQNKPRHLLLKFFRFITKLGSHKGIKTVDCVEESAARSESQTEDTER